MGQEHRTHSTLRLKAPLAGTIHLIKQPAHRGVQCAGLKHREVMPHPFAQELSLC
jgi:hypothetical protein